jgi:thiosulfate/3-mercaptopyruvate sulfurtransferase
MAQLSPLIPASELAARLDEPDLRILDASWHLDGTPALPVFEAGHIPGAAFFDLEALSDQDSDLPHMMPSTDRFAAGIGALGVSDTDRIVVYDTFGLFTAARAWWMLRAMGCDRVQVLDGGLPAWIRAGGGIERGPVHPAPAAFHPRPRPGMIADIDQVRAVLGSVETVLDARAAARFAGTAPEPRPGLRSGHMPGATNLPFGAVLNPDGTMKQAPELEAAFGAANVDLDRPVVTTCGSGVTAAVLSLALAVLGRDSRLYDGSWAEWGGRDDTPVAI